MKLIKKLSITAMLSMVALAAQAQTTVNVTSNITTDTTWTRDNVYVLTDIIYVEEGASLTIEPGTLIQGEPATVNNFDPGTLVITRNAQLFANGTIDQPIVFTSISDGPFTGPFGTLPHGSLTKDIRGLWGGLIVLGNAPTNLQPGSGSEFIEGLPNSDLGIIGGFNPDDSSGSIVYISIKHGGSAITDGNEINGLTLGGVGRGTTIQFVEIYANLDDGIEWFGGTVNVKYAIVAFCGDDALDSDFGWNGSVQFALVILNEANDVGDRGAEQDGGKDSDDDEPFGIPQFYNITVLGDGTNAPDGGTTAALWRDNARNGWTNSIFAYFSGNAVRIEDRATIADSFNGIEDESLKLNNNIFWGFGAGATLADLVQVDGDGGGDVQVVIDYIVANGNTIADPQLAAVDRSRSGLLDPRPAADGPATENLYTLPVRHPFIQDVLYKGAFNPVATPWTEGWSSLSRLGYTVKVN